MADYPRKRKETGSEKLTDAQETNRLLKLILKRLNETILTDFDMSTGLKTQSISVGASQPQKIAVENKDRKRLTVKNADTSSSAVVYLSDHPQMNLGAQIGTDAFQLKQNEQKDFNFHTNEMWALAASSTVLVTIAEE